MIIQKIISTFILLLPVFANIGVGYGLVKLKVFAKYRINTLNKFVFNICLPVIIFSAVTKSDFLVNLNFVFVLIYGFIALFIIALMVPYFYFSRQHNLSQSLIISFGAGASNSIFFGLPIAMAIIPDTALQIFSWVIVAECAIIIPIVSGLATFFDGRNDNQSYFISLIKNPVMVGLMVGVLFALSGFEMPDLMDNIRKKIIIIGSFLALFIIGGSLNGLRATHLFKAPTVLTSSAKLFLHPLVMSIALFNMPNISHDLLIGGILFTTLPMMSLSVVLAYRYQLEDQAALIIALSILMSIFSVPVIMSMVL